MLKLKDILDEDNLNKLVSSKHINVQKHPTLPLSIYNYSDKTTYDRLWNNETTRCRGLIVSDTGYVVASGPGKFYNYSEPNAPEVPLDTQVSVSPKHDGSLGIYWEYEGHKGIATRGSFASDQAIRGTQMLTGEELPGDIFEIVYPQNRIVLDYGGQEALLPLGSVDLKSGLIWRDGILTTLADVLRWDIPEDQEGYVVDILDDRLQPIAHVKLKGEWYVRMHSAIFGLTEKKVWESLKLGEDQFNDFVASLPDETHEWVKKVSGRMMVEFLDLHSKVHEAIDLIKSESFFENRKEVALHIQKNYNDVKSPIFAYLYGAGESKLIDWVFEQIKPGHVPFGN